MSLLLVGQQKKRNDSVFPHHIFIPCSVEQALNQHLDLHLGGKKYRKHIIEHLTDEIK